MRTTDEPLWTIDELGARVAVALAADYAGQPNGQVRDLPDRRTIRYYTTLGLLDRPAAMRGRTALYGRRHLLQLASVKRLQARGLSLAEIQQQLLGLSNAALGRIARLPPDTDEPIPSVTVETRDETDERRTMAFWGAVPEAAAERETQANLEHLSPLLHGVPLADDVALLLSPSRPIHADDLEAIRTVAAPLLKLLHKRRLLRPRDERTLS